MTKFVLQIETIHNTQAHKFFDIAIANDVKCIVTARFKLCIQSVDIFLFYLFEVEILSEKRAKEKRREMCSQKFSSVDALVCGLPIELLIAHDEWDYICFHLLKT